MEDEWHTVGFDKKAALGPSLIQPKQGGFGPKEAAWKVERRVDAEVGKPLELVSAEDRLAVIRGRTAAGLSQRDLATRLNLQFKDVQDIESGKALRNKQLVGRIKRLLGVE